MKNSQSFRITVVDVSANKLKGKFQKFESADAMKLKVVSKEKKGKRSSDFLEAFTIGAVSGGLFTNFLYDVMKCGFQELRKRYREVSDPSVAIVKLKNGLEIKIPSDTKKGKLKKIVKSIYELGEIESVSFQ